MRGWRRFRSGAAGVGAAAGEERDWEVRREIGRVSSWVIWAGVYHLRSDASDFSSESLLSCCSVELT